MSFREIVESDDFAHEKSIIEPDAERLDQMLFALTWALSQRPEHFSKVPGTSMLYMAKTDPFPGAPALCVWYRFDDVRVVLLSVETADEVE